MVEHPVQIELLSEFAGRETVQLVSHRAPAKQIGRAPLDLARAGATEREMQPAVFDQPMNVVE
jgi:hypothetical protein